MDHQDKEGGLMAVKSMTMILHSGDLDKALAAFILATGAAAKGMDVTMFFTFWGLNIVKKGGPAKAKLSRMNMGGLGTSMIRKRMAENNVASLEELIRDAKELGVRLVACEMTMQLMNVPKSELIPEVGEVGGVGTYLDAASEGQANLFI
jgi:peroxiredoxin family protein